MVYAYLAWHMYGNIKLSIFVVFRGFMVHILKIKEVWDIAYSVHFAFGISQHHTSY